MVNARSITAFFHNQSSTVVMFIMAAVCSFIACQSGIVVPDTDNMGIAFPSANLWLPVGVASAVLNLVGTAAVAVLIIAINREFNVLRSLTALVATMFVAMQLALPEALCYLNDGTLLAVVMLVCTALLFSVFGVGNGRQRLFLLFCVLGAAALWRLAFLFYLPVLLLGCAQMRVSTMRDLLAALLGVITPMWIVFGFGIVDPREVHLPVMVREWDAPLTHDAVRVMIVGGFTIVVGLCFTIANLMKILSYNARVRAFNGFFTLLFIATALLAVVNFNHLTFYTTLLNVMAAYQVGHFFTYRRHSKSFIPILLLILIYLGFFLWALVY